MMKIQPGLMASRMLAVAAVVAAITLLPNTLSLNTVSLRTGGGDGGMIQSAFLTQPPLLFQPRAKTCSPPSLVSLRMAKGKKNKKAAESAAPAVPVKSSSPPAATTSLAPAAAPAARTEVPAAAMVDDDGKENPELFAKAKAFLDEGRDTIGEVGIGRGKMITFVGQDGRTRTIGENERKGHRGDAEIVKVTSKTITVRLDGKFFGTRQWAFDAVSSYLTEKMPGMRVAIEDKNQLMDLYIHDLWYTEVGYKATREKGPQFVDARGVQVAQPYTADGKLRDLDDDANRQALQLGIEEMMKEALQQSSGSNFVDEPVTNIDKALRKSQTAYFSETSGETTEDELIESVQKVSLSPEFSLTGETTAEQAQALTEGNPMFEMMAKALEKEPGAMEDIQELLEKSNGNMFAVMSNPKFQKLAKMMMQNPEIMAAMSDPEQVKKAMNSAQQIGITKELGINFPGMGIDTAAKGFANKATEAVSKGVKAMQEVDSQKPDWLKEKEREVTQKAESMKEEESVNLNLRSLIAESDKKVVVEQPKKKPASREELGDDAFTLMRLMEESEQEMKNKPVQEVQSSGMNAAMKENLLYAAGGIFGVSAVVLFFAAQLGIVEVPFMQDVGVISTPATRRATPATETPKTTTKTPVVDDDPF